MGLFSGLKKAISGIWKGIKKVFRKVVDVVKKVLQSDLFKVVMIALSVVSLGTSLAAFGAGWGSAATQGASFVGKFINGGKAFLNNLVGAKFQTGIEAGMPGAPAVANAAAGAEQADKLAGMNTANAAKAGEVASTVGDVAAAVPGGDAAAKAANASNMANIKKGAEVVNTAADVADKAGTGNWLTKAAKGAKDIIMSEPGSRLIGNVLQGVGAGGLQEDEQDFQMRNERRFEDANDPGMKALGALDYEVKSKPGWAADPNGGRLAAAERVRQNLYTPTIPFETDPVYVGQGS